MATTEAPTTPVAAARRAPTNTTARARPPRRAPKSRPMECSRSSARRERWRIVPMSTKKGTARSTWFSMIPNTRSGKLAR